MERKSKLKLINLWTTYWRIYDRFFNLLCSLCAEWRSSVCWHGRRSVLDLVELPGEEHSLGRQGNEPQSEWSIRLLQNLQKSNEDPGAGAQWDQVGLFRPSNVPFWGNLVVEQGCRHLK